VGERKVDKRYNKTEKKILKVLSEFVRKNPYTIDVRASRIAHKAKVGRATVYRHYKGANEALFLYGRKVFGKFRTRIVVMQQSGASFADLIFYIVKFMNENKDFFGMAFACGDRRVFERMMQEIGKEVADYAMMDVLEMERIKRVYYGEIYGVLDEWNQGGFCEVEMERVKTDIIYLTKHAKIRLNNICRR